MTSSPILAFTAVLAVSATKAGFFGNNAEESVYPMTRWLTDGEVLDGSEHNYTLTFPAKQMPPGGASGLRRPFRKSMDSA